MTVLYMCESCGYSVEWGQHAETVDYDPWSRKVDGPRRCRHAVCEQGGRHAELNAPPRASRFKNSAPGRGGRGSSLRGPGDQNTGDASRSTLAGTSVVTPARIST
jgi:hypothetical protein